ncbi:MAG: hypothetical protein ACIAQF_12755 [Phycisphaerales bacterium JB065]
MSTGSSTRQTIAHAIVVCGIIFAACSFVIAPLEKERASNERELNSLQARVATSAKQELSKQANARVLERANEYERAIQTRSEGANDELALHQVYHELASKWDIEIDRFDPSVIKVSTSRGKKDKDLLKPDFAASVRIDAVGTLDHVVAMLDELTRKAGFVSVRSMKISPLSGSADKRVKMRLECDHYSFAIPQGSDLVDNQDGKD